MELSSVFVLTLVSLVTGTPHGYGVKGGAVAKAEANAAASAFGVLPAIPLTIPSGGGFSGSFSKSSSSSFASSSASASSSSSSYSFSGSGVNGIAGYGCQSNNCKNSGNTIPTELHSSFGNEAQSNGGALTGSTAASNAYSGNVGNLPCSGNSCDTTGKQQDTPYGLHSSNNYNLGSNCATGKCNSEVQNGNSQNGYESSKCVSGNCSPTPQQPSNSNAYGVDSTGKSQSTSTYDLNSDKTDLNRNSNDGKSRLDCFNGNCQPIPTLDSATPSQDEHDIFIPLTPSENRANPIHPKPTTELVAPNLGPACTSHTCNIAPSGPDSYNGKLPTSYNVPILGPKPSTKIPVADGSNNNPGSLYNLPTGASSSINCGSAGCSDITSPTVSASSKPSTYSHGNYPSQLLVAPDVSSSCSGSNCKSLDSQNSQIPNYQLPSKQLTNCNTAECSYYPATGSSVSYPSQYDSSKPSYSTGGAGASSKISTPSSNTPASGPRDNSINNGGYTSNTGSYNFGSHQGSFDVKSKPSVGSPSQNLPSYNGELSKPTGSFDRNNEYTPPHGLVENSKPLFGVSSTTQNTPIYTGGFGGPTGSIDTSSGIGTHFASKPSHGQSSASGGFTTNTASYNIGSQSGSVDEKYKSNVDSTNQNLPIYTGGFTKPSNGNNEYTSSHGPTGTSKPQFGISSTTQNTPIYTGGFGGPVGSIDTNFGVGTQFTSKPSHGQASTNGGLLTNTGSFNENYKPTSQNLPSYNGGLTKPAGAIDGNNGHTPLQGSTVTSKPHLTVSSTTQNTPIYTSGFGGAAGSIDTISGFGTHFALKPSHDRKPLNNNNIPHTTSTGSETASNEANLASDSYSGLHGITKPSSSLVPPTHNNPTSAGHFMGSHGPTTVIQHGIASLPTKPNYEKNKLPVYTGGFGGPTGLLKPNEFNIPVKSPETTLNNYTPTSCISGSCDIKGIPNLIGAQKVTNGASNILSASSNAKAIAYSGGFGGPPGFLKPNDNGKHPKGESYESGAKHQSNIHDYTNSGIGSVNIPSGGSIDESNSGVHDGAKTNAGAQANDGALTNAGAQGNGGAHANDEVQPHTGAQTNVGAQANAVAFASSSSFSSNLGTGETGCNSGCGSNYDSRAGHNFASSNSLGVSHTGGLDDIHNGPVGASASAKSVAGASAGVFGAGRSFAGSSAAAHSSAGASVKGGYGR